MARMSQTKFFTILAIRAKKHGFTIRLGALREKRTGMCPVVAVAAQLGLKGFRKFWNRPAAEKMGLSEDFADKVAVSADTADPESPFFRKLLRTVGLAQQKGVTA
jgi:hypothetical protein